MDSINVYKKSHPEPQKAIVAYLRRGTEVLLGERKRSSTGLGVNRIAGLGGKVEKDDDNLIATLIRELQEEVHITPTKYRRVGRVIFYNVNPAEQKWNMDVEVFIVEEWEGEPTETDETKPVWYEIKEVPLDRMFRDNRYWLPHVLDGKEVEAEFLFGEDHEIVESEIHFRG